MSKATPATTSASAPAPHAGSTRGRTAPAHRKPRRPVIFGITIFAVLVGLALLARATGLTAAWPAGASISITISATVTCRGAHRQRR